MVRMILTGFLFLGPGYANLLLLGIESKRTPFLAILRYLAEIEFKQFLDNLWIDIVFFAV